MKEKEIDKYRKAKKGFCTLIGLIGLLSGLVGIAIHNGILYFIGFSITSIALIIRTFYLS